MGGGGAQRHSRALRRLHFPRRTGGRVSTHANVVFPRRDAGVRPLSRRVRQRLPHDPSAARGVRHHNREAADVFPGGDEPRDFELPGHLVLPRVQIPELDVGRHLEFRLRQVSPVRTEELRLLNLGQGFVDQRNGIGALDVVIVGRVEEIGEPRFDWTQNASARQRIPIISETQKFSMHN